MAPAVIIECYHPCALDGFSQIAGRFRALLDRLGYIENDSQWWNEPMGWNREEDCWNGPICHTPSMMRDLVVAGRELEAQVCFAGYKLEQEYVPPRGWIGTEVNFDTEGEKQYLVSQSAFAPGVATYLPGVGRALWQVIRAFAAEFPDRPVYCVFEGFWGKTWKALEFGEGDLWSFEAALIPRALAPRFSSRPDTVTAQATSYGLALARRDVWLSPPWLEAL